MINEYFISISHQCFPIGIPPPTPTYFCTVPCKSCTAPTYMPVTEGTKPSTQSYAFRWQSWARFKGWEMWPWSPRVTRRQQHRHRDAQTTDRNGQGKQAWIWLGWHEAPGRCSRVSQWGGERPTSWARAATASGRGADERAEQHHSCTVHSGPARRSPWRGGRDAPQACTTGWKLRTAAGASGLSPITSLHPTGEAI